MKGLIAGDSPLVNISLNAIVHTMSEKRRYTLKERARAQDETRQRIVEATMALHEERGPRATTISAIAERAGVQRLTVYRHFPDETAVFEACTSHWLALNPPPSPELWAGATGNAAIATAIDAFDAYYDRTRRMWSASHRDVDHVPALQEPMRRFGAYLDGLAGSLAAGRAPPVRVTIAHLLTFPTWQSLQAAGVAVGTKAPLGLAWIAGAERMDGA
jgi:AcrR family transcriptional regulator